MCFFFVLPFLLKTRAQTKNSHPRRSSYERFNLPRGREPLRVYLDYKNRNPVVYIALWSHGEQSRGPVRPDPHDPRTFIMASEKSTPELPVLDKKNDDGITSEISKATSSSHGERVVTRKELWSYYCKSRTSPCCPCSVSNNPSTAYYNGGSVRPL
jgi:hypothetical protein